MTTVQGLDKAYDPKKILKAFKKVSVSGRQTIRSIYWPLANSRQRSRTTLHAIRRTHCTTRRVGPRRNSHATATSCPPKKPSSEPTLLNPPSLRARPSPISDRSSSCKAIRGTRSGISLLARGSSRRGRPRRRFRCEFRRYEGVYRVPVVHGNSFGLFIAVTDTRLERTRRRGSRFSCLLSSVSIPHCRSRAIHINMSMH